MSTGTQTYLHNTNFLYGAHHRYKFEPASTEAFTLHSHFRDQGDDGGGVVALYSQQLQCPCTLYFKCFSNMCVLTQISTGDTERQKKNYCMARADLSHEFIS
jgi:hypothetical protein